LSFEECVDFNLAWWYKFFFKVLL